MALVGCTPENAPLIEETMRRLCAMLEEQCKVVAILVRHAAVAGRVQLDGPVLAARGRSDAERLMRKIAPLTFRWLAQMDDLSGLEGAWRKPGEARGPIVETAAGALPARSISRSCMANAKAVAEGKETFAFTALGMPYEQGAFKYQVKCLETLRRMYAELPAEAKAEIDPMLERTGCRAALNG